MTKNEYSAARRRKLREMYLCINAPMPGARRYRRLRVTHGPLVPGEIRCARCKEIHAKSRGESGGDITRLRRAA